MVLAAVPVALPAGEAIIALSTLLLWLGCVVLLFVYRGTLGAILLGLARLVDDVSLPGTFGHGQPLGAIADALRSVHHAIDKELADQARRMETYAAYFLDKTWATLKALGQFQVDLAHTVEGVVSNIYRRAIPEAERRALKAALRAVGALAGTVAGLKTVAIPAIRADVGELGGQVGHIDDAIRGLRERVRGHERLLVGAGLTALAIRMLGRLKLGWLRCTKVGRMGRATCAMDLDFLNSVIATATVMFGSYSIVAFAEEMQDVTDELAGLVRHFWRADIEA